MQLRSFFPTSQVMAQSRVYGIKLRWWITYNIHVSKKFNGKFNCPLFKILHEMQKQVLGASEVYKENLFWIRISGTILHLSGMEKKLNRISKQFSIPKISILLGILQKKKSDHKSHKIHILPTSTSRNSTHWKNLLHFRCDILIF